MHKLDRMLRVLNDVRSNLENRITPDELYGAFLSIFLVVYYVVKSFRNVLWTTSPDFPSSWGQGIMNNFWVNLSFISLLLM